MKKILILVVVLLSHCSFDTKTGIWENSNKVISKDESFKNYKKLYVEEKLFDNIIEPQKDLIIDLGPIEKNLVWLNKDFSNSNNSNNFSFKNLNEIIFKSKKLSRDEINENILFDGDKVISTNNKGDIIVYSIKEKNIILKYNFYKKKLKNIDKKLDISIDDYILYVSDNSGYVYALDYNNKKLLWAKNYKVPFRSNLKIFDDKVLIADTNNVLYLINKYNGEQLRSIPTEENPLKSVFSNSLASNDQFLFFLNTYGSVYSTNYEGDIRWFLNVNRSVSLKTTNLFYSNPIIVYEDKIIISTDSNLYIMNAFNGSLVNKFAISSIVKPIISNQNLFLITDKKLLVCINLNTGTITYSLDIDSQIANFLNTKKKTVEIKTLFFVNNDLYVFLNNSYLVKFSSIGNITNISKLPSKMRTFPIFINDSILYLNNKNRLIILD